MRGDRFGQLASSILTSFNIIIYILSNSKQFITTQWSHDAPGGRVILFFTLYDLFASTYRCVCRPEVPGEVMIILMLFGVKPNNMLMLGSTVCI